MSHFGRNGLIKGLNVGVNTHTFVFSLAVIIELVACKRLINFLEILTDSGVIIGTANCGAVFHILVFARVKNIF